MKLRRNDCVFRDAGERTKLSNCRGSKDQAFPKGRPVTTLNRDEKRRKHLCSWTQSPRVGEDPRWEMDPGPSLAHRWKLSTIFRWTRRSFLVR